MKTPGWLVLCLAVMCTFGLASGPSAAGEGVGEPPSPVGTPPQGLGVLAPAQAEVHVAVPKEGRWQAPESSFVLPDSISVQPQNGPPLIRREGEPRLGQFSLRPDGMVVFTAADAGRPFVVRYQFRPRRVALLDAASPGDHADAQPLLWQALAEELGKHGCVVVPAPQVKDAAAALGLETIPPHAPPPPEQFAALAQSVNAAYVLIPGIGLSEHSRPDDFDTGIPIPQEKDRPPSSVLYEEPTLVLPVTRSRLYGAVRLVIVDGATGTVVGDEMTSDFQRVRWRRYSPARRSLIESLVAKVAAAWREPAR